MSNLDHLNSTEYCNRIPRSRIQLVYEHQVPYEHMIQLNSIVKSKEFIIALFGDDINYQEHAYVISLNRALKVTNTLHLAKGGTAACPCDLKIVSNFIALNTCDCLIFAHNHPSGNPNPSHEDRVLTKKLKDLCGIMGVSLTDSMILTSQRQIFSFADEGIL
jgi:DNA repair protein RadC